MKWALFFILIFAIVVIHQAVFSIADLGYWTPDLLLLLTLAVVWSFSNFNFIFIAVLGGLWLEILLGLPVGALSLGMVLIGSILQVVINKWFYSEKPWQFFVIGVVAGTIVLQTWIYLYTQSLSALEIGTITFPREYFWRSLIPASIMNLLLIYPVFALVELMAKYLQNLSKNKLQL